MQLLYRNAEREGVRAAHRRDVRAHDAAGAVEDGTAAHSRVERHRDEHPVDDALGGEAVEDPVDQRQPEVLGVTKSDDGRSEPGRPVGESEARRRAADDPQECEVVDEVERDERRRQGSRAVDRTDRVAVGLVDVAADHVVVGREQPVAGDHVPAADRALGPLVPGVDLDREDARLESLVAALTGCVGYGPGQQQQQRDHRASCTCADSGSGRSARPGSSGRRRSPSWLLTGEFPCEPACGRRSGSRVVRECRASATVISLDRGAAICTSQMQRIRPLWSADGVLWLEQVL